MSKVDVKLRPANPGDVQQILELQTWYVQNTAITFQFEPFSHDEMLAKYHKVVAEHLPYVVAVTPEDKVLGYCSASKFRSAKHGYVHTVELSLFVHHDYTRHGTGPLLLNRLVHILRDPHKYPDYVANPDARPPVHQLLACMAIDPAGPKKGLALKEFYERYGFVEVGHLRKVGYKFDRWIDTMYMQLSLRE